MAHQYGTTGNSFIAVVECADKVGALRDVYFYPEDIKANAELVYHPGQ